MEVVAVLILLWLLWAGGSGSKDSDRKSGDIKVSFETSSGRGYVRTRQRSPEEAYDDSHRAWVPPGEAVTVKGRHLEDGMIYVGKNLPALDGYRQSDPALINPKFRAESQRPDHSGRHLDYWPSYESIPRSSRAAYLDWLADGRRDPDIAVGYVFLFFYGLERRILLDAQVAEQARSELPLLIEEIEELLQVYGDKKRSFERYATELLKYTRLVHGLVGPADSAEKTPVDAATVDWKMGELIAAGEPIPAPIAARWAHRAAAGELRTPARRCREAFLKLFEVRYREKWEDGLRIRASGPSLEVSYGAASAGLRREFTHAAKGIVDAERVRDIRAPLVGLAKSVETELEDYSRWIGRRDDRSSPAAIGLLPRPIVQHFAGGEAELLIERFENRLDEDDSVVVPADWIVAPWPTRNDEYMTGKEAEAFSGFLEGFDLGIEPDVRYSRNPSKRDHVVIFRIPSEVHPPGEKFEAARLLLHLAAAVAGADEEISKEEERHIESHLEEALDLSPSERARLRARLARQLEHPPTLRGVRRKAEELDHDQRRKLAKFLVTVAGADGHLDHGEVQVLEKIYEILQLGADSVHRDLHDLAARVPGDRGPVTVLEADEHDSGFAIPDEKASDSPREFAEGVTLDMDRLAAVQAETRDVSQQLAGVFAEDEMEQESHRVNLGGNGLSEDHLILLDAFVEQASLSRSDFERLAEQQGLMPGFAIEQINSASLDMCGEPLLEGTDPIELNTYALEEVQHE